MDDSVATFPVRWHVGEIALRPGVGIGKSGPVSRIPDQLWGLAVKPAEAHGLSRTASTLKLDYHTLKKRVAAKTPDCSSVSGEFIELSPPSLAPSGECVVEFEDGLGASMRVHLRGCDVPDLVALGRSFWSGE